MTTILGRSFARALKSAPRHRTYTLALAACIAACGSHGATPEHIELDAGENDAALARDGLLEDAEANAPADSGGDAAEADASTDKPCGADAGCVDAEYVQWGRDDHDDYVRAIAFDEKGALYTLTESHSYLPYTQLKPSLDEHLGYSDLGVARMARANAPGWARKWGFPGFDIDRAILGTADGFYALAETDPANVIGSPSHFSSVGIGEFGSDGSFKRSKIWSTSASQSVRDFTRAPNGDLLVVVSVEAAAYGQAYVAGNDAILLRISPTFETSIATAFGTTGSDSPLRVVSDASSNAYVLGLTDGKFTALALPAGFHGFVAKVDTSGQRVWLREYGPTELGAPKAIVHSAGKLYIASQTNFDLYTMAAKLPGPGDAMVVRLDLDGAIEWAKTFGGPGDETVAGFAVEADGNLLVAGATFGGFAGRDVMQTGPGKYANSDLYVVRFATTGEQREAWVWGTNSNDYISSLATAPHGGFAVAGSTNSTFIAEDKERYEATAFIRFFPKP